MSMDLKSFRAYDEHDVVNGLYSTVEGTLSKGTVLEYVSADPDNQNGFGDSLVNTPSYAFSADYVVNWKVKAAVSGSTKLAGLLLKDVVTNVNAPWATDARFVDPAVLAEKQIIPSGRAVPFVTKGIFTVTGYDMSAGAPGAGSGLYVSNSGGGVIAVGNPATDTRTRIGTAMTSTGVNGELVIKLSIPNN